MNKKLFTAEFNRLLKALRPHLKKECENLVLKGKVESVPQMTEVMKVAMENLAGDILVWDDGAFVNKLRLIEPDKQNEIFK